MRCGTCEGLVEPATRRGGVTRDVIALAYTELGHGSAVVLLHGVFGSSLDWAGLARRLSRSHRIILADLPNHGSSPRVAEMDYRCMARSVLDLLHRLGVPRASLIGHSMGGKIAAAMALIRPDAVDRILAVDVAPAATPGDLSGIVTALSGVPMSGVCSRSAFEPALAHAVPDKRTRTYLLRSLEIDGGQARWAFDLRALAANIDNLKGWPCDLERLRFNGLARFLIGDRSPVVGPYEERAIRRHFPGADIVRVANATHWLPAEQRALFMRHVSNFLALPHGPNTRPRDRPRCARAHRRATGPGCR
jgi:esterase